MHALLAEIQAYLDIIRDEQAKLARLRKALSARSGAFIEAALVDVKQWELVLKRLEASVIQIINYMEEEHRIKALTAACSARSYINSVRVKSSQLTGLSAHIYANLQPLMARISDTLSKLCED